MIRIRDQSQRAPTDDRPDQDDLFSSSAITDDPGAVTQRYMYGDNNTRITTDLAGATGFEAAPALD